MIPLKDDVPRYSTPWMTYLIILLNAAVFLLFLQKLVAGARRKILLIADRLQAHKTPEVEAWVAARGSYILWIPNKPHCRWMMPAPARKWWRASPA